MAGTLSTLSIVSFVLAGFFAVLTVLLGILFKIPTVIGDLTGRTARKSIAKMRNANERTGVKAYKESKTNAARGKITDSMAKTGPRQSKQQKTAMQDSLSESRPQTTVLAENRVGASVNDAPGQSGDTKRLSEETVMLQDDESATTLLDTSASARAERVKRASAVRLFLIEETMLVHTEEVIEI